MPGERPPPSAGLLAGVAERVHIPHGHREGRVVAEVVGVVEILVPERDAEEPLSEELLDGVFDARGLPMVDESAGHAGEKKS